MARLNIGRPETVVREQIEIAVAANGINYINDLNSAMARTQADMDELNIDLQFGIKSGREYNDEMRRLIATYRDLSETARMATEYIQDGSMKLGTAQSRAAALSRGLLEVSRGFEDWTTAGWIGALNNVPTMMDNIARYVGLMPHQVAALTAATGFAATAAFILYRNWGYFHDAIMGPAPKTAIERMDELAHKTRKTAEEQAELNRLKERQHDIDTLSGLQTVGQKSQEDMVKKAFEETIGSSDNAGAWFRKGMYGGDLSRLYTDAEKRKIAEAAKPTRLMNNPFAGMGGNATVAVTRTPEELRRDIDRATHEVEAAALKRMQQQNSDMAAQALKNPEMLRAYIGAMEKGGASPEFLDKLRSALPENIEKLRKFRDEAKSITEAFADLRRQVDAIDWSKPEAGATRFAEIMRPMNDRIRAFKADIAGLTDKDTHRQLTEVTKTFEDMFAAGAKKFHAADERAKEDAKKAKEKEEGRNVKAVAGEYSRTMRKDAEVDVARALAEGANPDEIQALLVDKASEAMRKDPKIDPGVIDEAAGQVGSGLLGAIMPRFTTKGKTPKEAAAAWMQANNVKADEKAKAQLDRAVRAAEARRKQEEMPWDKAASQWDGGTNDYLERLFFQNRQRQEEAHAAMGAGLMTRGELARNQRAAAAEQAREVAAIRNATRKLPVQQQREAMNAYWNTAGPGKILSDAEMKDWLTERAAAQMMSAGEKSPVTGKPLTPDEAKRLAAKVTAQALKEAQARQNQANARTLDTMSAINAAMTEVAGAQMRYLQQLDRVRAQANGVRTAASTHRR